MFRSTARNLRTWWTDFSDDILGADLVTATPAETGLDYHLTHPHRRPLVSSLVRRDGVVPARPAFCLSPVRSSDHHRTAQRIEA